MLTAMTKNIPPLPPFDPTPVVRNAADMHRQWRTLMGEWGFAERTLWFTFIAADGEVVKVLQQIAQIPLEPDTRTLDNVINACTEFLASSAIEDGSAAFLLSRPGSAQFTSSDRAWASGLVKAARRGDLRLQPIHLATDDDVRVFAADDLID